MKACTKTIIRNLRENRLSISLLSSVAINSHRVFSSSSATMSSGVFPTAAESQRRLQMSADGVLSLHTLEQFVNSSSDGNTFRDELIVEDTGGNLSQFQCRQVKNAHYSETRPERVPMPAMLCVSRACAVDLGLSPEELQRDLSLQVFSGSMDFNPKNPSLHGFNSPYTTVYGCHSYGHWFGQLGDGRAVMLGEVEAPAVLAEDGAELAPRHKYVVQLKGSGRTPYSRHGDGRAVLRSSIREFFASEAMHFLGVPTTRALCVISTGQMITRRWYKEKTDDAAASGQIQGKESEEKSSGAEADKSSWSVAEKYAHKYPPHAVFSEHGAVLTRISPCTMVRIAQLELFAKRDDAACALRLADYVIKHEFPDILAEDEIGDEAFTSDGLQMQDAMLQLEIYTAKRYVSMYRRIADRCAYLVAQWMRVGYVQGNMNADNILIGGKTIDYGPFGMMEEYDPAYQPFTSDDDGHFSFSEQPTAMLVNIYTLSSTIAFLVDSTVKDPAAAAELHADIKAVYDVHFHECFSRHFTAVKHGKLGVLSEPELLTALPQIAFKELISPLYKDLLTLMHTHRCDYTVMFRNSSEIARLLLESQGALSVSRMLELTAGDGAIPVDDATMEVCLALIRDSTHIPGKIEPVEDVSSGGIPWREWLGRYLRVLVLDTIVQLSGDDAAAEGATLATVIARRQMLQNSTNPKFIMRNYMAAAVYEEFNSMQTARAQSEMDPDSPPAPININDPGLLWHDMMKCIENPYDLPELLRSPGLDKYFAKSPSWAIDLPGLAFMS